MKLLKTLSTLWKYREYDTVYFIHDTSRLGDIVVTIRLAKVLGCEGPFLTLLLMDGSKKQVHRSWTADTYRDAKRIKKEIIEWEKNDYYDIIDRTTKR